MTADTETPSAVRSADSQSKTLAFGLFLACLLLVVSSVAWRQGVYFSGAADPVVLAKAALTLLALGIAWLMPRPPGTWWRFRAAPVIWIGTYVAISIVGGLLNGDPVASVILAFRLCLFALVLLLLAVTHPWEQLLIALAAAMLLVGCLASVTGISSFSETGRLNGTIPPLHPNAICFLISAPAVVVFWRCVIGPARKIAYVGLIPLLGIVWLTGSRTGLATLVLGLILVLILSGRLPTPVAGALLVAIPIILYLTFFTPYITEFATRGDPGNVTSLSSRTTAWAAAQNYADTTGEKLFGSGLALKEIPVSAAYRTEQILDSSWFSALLQAGFLGVAVAGLFVIVTLVRSLQLPRPQRSLTFALASMLAVGSVLESGLFDTSTEFIVFFAIAIMTGEVRRCDRSRLNLDQLE